MMRLNAKVKALEEKDISQLARGDNYAHNDESKTFPEKQKFDNIIPSEKTTETVNELDTLERKMIKQKDEELQQVLKYKDEEIKQLKAQYEKNKSNSASSKHPDHALYSIKDSEVTTYATKTSEDEAVVGARSDHNIDKHAEIMEKRLNTLQNAYKILEDKYRRECLKRRRKEREFRKLSDDYDAELRKIIKMSKEDAVRHFNSLKRCESALSECFASDDDSMISGISKSRFSDISYLRASAMSLTDDDFSELSLSATPRNVEAEKEGKFDDSRRISSIPQQNNNALGRTEDMQNKKPEEKERHLQKKVVELQSQVSRLERKIGVLKTENDIIKKRQDDHRPLEEKVKSLKKRNAELAAIARRLEEKARVLQQENIKKSKEESNVQDVEHIKKLFARQRAKDQAEFSKEIMAKDREIEELRVRCQQLSEQLTQHQYESAQNSEVYEEKEELVNIIKQAAKERLNLETQLVRIKPTMNESESARIQELEATNKELQKEKHQLGKDVHHLEQLESELAEKRIEANNLRQDIETLRDRTEELESEVQESASKKSELAELVNSLQERLIEFDQVSKECNTLRVSLTDAKQDSDTQQTEVSDLQNRLEKLENVIQDLQESKKGLTHIETKYEKAKETLNSKEDEIAMLHKYQGESQHEYNKALSELQTKLVALDTKWQNQEEELEMYRKYSDGSKPTDQSDQNSKDSGIGNSKEMPNIHSNRSSAQDQMSALEAKGLLQVFVAKYNYDPFQYSPNENPDSELPLNAGDYVLIFGEMDEDGFYEGELVDGRHGLVPSNFIEKVSDENLPEFHAYLALTGQQSEDRNFSSSFLNDLDFNSSDEAEKFKFINEDEATQKEEDSRSSQYMETTEDSLTENVTLGSEIADAGVPHPQKLSLDRQLTNSIVLSWSIPEGVDAGEVKAYHMYVDDDFKMSIQGTERTKALVEDIDSQKVHRISVRTITAQGQSEDERCTILIGKDALPGPSDLKVGMITANSAKILWLPGNSNYHHVILVNGEEHSVAKPGDYQSVISGLAPATNQKVIVRARCLTVKVDERTRRKIEMLSASVEFTTAVAGVPDPPLGVQVEAGPQNGSLLLTWLPVTISTSGTSNGALVHGYAVYADGRRVKEIKGSINDHMVLRSDDFRGFVPKQLTVRTLTSDNEESLDSDIAFLPQNLVKEVMATAVKSKEPEITVQPIVSQKRNKTDEDGQDTDEEIEAAFRDVTKQRSDDQVLTDATLETTVTINPHYKDEIMDSSSSELSDIAEVEEDIASEMSHDDQSKSISQATPPKKQVVTVKSKAYAIPTPRTSIMASPKADSVSPKSPALSPMDTTGKSVSHIIVPEIEITRDSSTEKGSWEGSEEDVNSERSLPRNPVAESKTKSETTKSSSDVDSHQGYRNGDRQKHGDVSKDRFTKNNQNPVYGPISPVEKEKSYYNHSDNSANSVNTGERLGSKQISHDDSMESEYLEEDDLAERDSIIGDARKVRLFVALFDYDPASMSPNVDEYEDELPFKEGQMLKIYGDSDADGFFRGECCGRTGFVPCNMVSEVQVDDPDVAEQLLIESHSRPILDKSPIAKQKYQLNNRTEHLSPNEHVSGPSRKMIAMYDYDPQELSPNVDAELELSFQTGDVIMVSGDLDDDGFYMGELNGIRGLVPSNFLHDIYTSDEDIPDSTNQVALSRNGEKTKSKANQKETVDKSTKRRSERSSHAKEKRAKKPAEQSKSQPIKSAPIVPHDNEKSPKRTQNNNNGHNNNNTGILNKGRNIFKKLTR